MRRATISPFLSTCRILIPMERSSTTYILIWMALCVLSIFIENYNSTSFQVHPCTHPEGKVRAISPERQSHLTVFQLACSRDGGRDDGRGIQIHWACCQYGQTQETVIYGHRWVLTITLFLLRQLILITFSRWGRPQSQDEPATISSFPIGAGS